MSPRKRTRLDRKMDRLGTSCATKGWYSTYGRAVNARASATKRGSPPLRIYKCKPCHGFHLTSRPTRPPNPEEHQ